MKKCNGANPGILFLMFGIGLLFAFVFPSKFLVMFLSVALIISGIVLCRSC